MTITGDPRLRLLSYNVRGLRDDRAALARVIRAARPDVVCIQESPAVVRWRARCAALARISGLVVAGGGRTAAANLLLTSLRVDVISHTDVLFTKEIGRFQRGAVLAHLRLGGAEFAVVGTHLDLHEAGRLRHVTELQTAVAQHLPDGVAVIVAGDVNDVPGSATWAALADGRVDLLAGPGRGGTYPAGAPRRAIDGVFADPRLPVVVAEVRTGADVALASDHCPVLVEFDLPTG